MEFVAAVAEFAVVVRNFVVAAAVSLVVEDKKKMAESRPGIAV